MQRKSLAPPPQLFLEGSNLYASQGSVYALNGKDGSTRQIYPIAGQLTVANDVLYLNVSCHPDYLVQAVRSSDGSVLWSYQVEGRLVQSPVLYNDGVYVCTAEGDIYALHVSDGTLLWHATITLDANVPSYLGPIVFTAPTIINNILYLAPIVNSPLKPFIYAFQAKDGTLLWQNSIPEASSFSFAVSDGILCLSVFNGCLALDMHDGSVIWQKEFDTATQVISQPVVLNGIVYLCFSKYRDDLSSSVRDEKVPWHQTFICALEVKNGSLLWQQPLGSMLQTSHPPELSVVDNVLLIGSYDGVLSAYQCDNGKILWSRKISESSLSSPVGKNDVVYISDSEGYIYALRLAESTLLWQSLVNSTITSAASLEYKGEVATLHSDGESKIEILEFHEAARKRPQMYIGSTDQQGLHRLLQLTVEHRLFHYDFLGQALDTIMIRLEEDGSATVTSKAATVSEAFLEGNVQLLETKRRIKLFNLFIVAAFCERLSVTVRGPNNHWRSLIFERGVLCSDDSHSIPPEEDCEIWLRLWPDFTILEASIFDSQQTSALMQPFAESHPAVAITVIDARPQSA